MVVKPQGQIDHRRAFGNDLGTTAEASKIMADVAVVLFDGKGQILAGKELVLGNEAMKPLPIVGQESVTSDTDFGQMPLTGGIITPTQKPGQSSPLERIIDSPKPYFVCLFLIK
jgi:hypothetical protein